MNTQVGGDTKEAPAGRRLAVLSLAALGVVYGDIGTSPLYALRECFHGAFGIDPVPDNVLGVLSLVFWALITVVSIKYLTFILKADNHGEGGVVALTALLRSRAVGGKHRRRVLMGLGMFGVALLYGDGMITPAISVLSAVEGLGEAAPTLGSFVIPVTVGILALLFLFQKSGTARVGSLFGPVVLVWFATLAVLGGRQILGHPEVLKAVSPTYGAAFLIRNHLAGFLVLAAVFLVVTGAEALYADMGHFGRRPIRLAWSAVVLPALLLNYFGQGSVLMLHPQSSAHPFYALVPAWGLIPMVVLATMATIIASQAVISGAFSMTRQVVQLGYLPRLQIVHTSAEEKGQIYIPQINALLMVAAIALVLGFRSSSNLAAAYGVAVTTTMTISTLLFAVVARQRWNWSRWAIGGLTGLFLCVDLSFFGANIVKVQYGGWFPLLIGGGVYLLMTTWKKGREVIRRRKLEETPSLQEFLDSITPDNPARVEGHAVYLTASKEGVPATLVSNLKHNKVLHEKVIFLTLETEEIPRVPKEEKVEVEDLGKGIHRVVARFGFMEYPRAPHALALARDKGLDFDMEKASFFVGRERALATDNPDLAYGRDHIFAFMMRNAIGATTFYQLPPNQVIELGDHIEI